MDKDNRLGLSNLQMEWGCMEDKLTWRDNRLGLSNLQIERDVWKINEHG